MKAYITEVEIYDDDTDSKMLIAKLQSFDEEAFVLTINERIVTGDELREIADLLDSDILRKPLGV